MSKLPIKPSPKRKKENALPISLYLPVFRWCDQKFLNLNDQSEEYHQIWKFTSLVYLNTQFNSGRKVFGELEKYKVRAVNGEIIEVEKRKLKGKEFGFKALASALSANRGLKISPEEVQILVEDAISKNLNHAKVVLESDLYPTDPQIFKEMGLKNRYLIVANVPDSNKMNRRINEQLKKSGSPLRIQKQLKTKIVEA